MGKHTLHELWRENRGLLLFLALMFVFRSSFADWNTVPTGSMKPTIVEGDRILVNKAAYDIRVPFTQISVVKMAEPERGDIIVFESAAAENRLVKRVIGLPGDTISLNNNRLFINGAEIKLTQADDREDLREFSEHLSGQTHLIRLAHEPSPLASFHSVKVPADSYLALGDNRDNSADSRVIGFVPRHEIIGRTRQVVLSLNVDNYYLPRKDRFFKTL